MEEQSDKLFLTKRADVIVKTGWIISLICMILFSISIALHIFRIDAFSIVTGNIKLPIRVEYDFLKDSENITYDKESVKLICHDSITIASGADIIKEYKLVNYLVYTLVFTIVFGKLRKILNSIKSGSPFRAKNIKRVKEIGSFIMYLGIFKFFMDCLTMPFFSKLISIAVTAEGFHYNSSGFFSSSADFTLIFVGLAIYLTSLIFIVGHDIQEENELTI